MTDYLQMGLPMLCLGDAALTLCTAIGGKLVAAEGGIITVEYAPADDLFDGVEDGERYLPNLCAMTISADQGDVCATVDDAVIGIRVRQRNVWGIALPLERNDPSTTRLLVNFCRDKCGCTLWWSERAFIERAKAAILEAAGDNEAICALSGGVDSGVSALLGHLALGQRLHCIFVDTGLLREGEVEEVMSACQLQVGLKVRRVDARAEFLLALQGVTDPDEKERIIRSLLREVLRREAEALPGVKLLLRGTNYADEVSPEDAAALPTGLQVIEPVKELFKDEIRHVGESLGLPASITGRQPFPGSGLASRIMTSVTAERLAILRTADAIFRREIETLGLQKRLWQYFAALTLSPLPDGGIMVILRAVQAAEGGSGMPARLPSDLLERVTAEIMQACPDVQRVFYDCTPSRTYAQLAGK
jgi:GMP synthase (glutamine-hydrolysing)